DQDVIKSATNSITLRDLSNKLLCGHTDVQLTATGFFNSKTSPPPFMVGVAKVRINTLTGEIKVKEYTGVVDCGTTINPSLAKVQAEGGIVQGIGMALYEDVVYNEKGRMVNDSLMSYKLPTRLDVGKINVEFIESFEPTGPYGAKSIGEVVINTPSPAIYGAILNACGISLTTLPFKAEDILLNINKK
ncbi:MAG: xanthine dehydrogenase family protein molybdopterin-binding subunit, partial [Bacilli bacterium]